MGNSGRLERGSCFCGAVVAEARGNPFWTNYDHDDDCRKALGSPLTVWIGYRQDQVHFTEGEPAEYSKTPGIVRTFCARCGSSIGYQDEGLPGEIWLTIGFMDRPENFKPEAHAFWKMKLPWVEIADDLPKAQEYTRERDARIGYPADRRG